jgi:hypothetical protein
MTSSPSGSSIALHGNGVATVLTYEAPSALTLGSYRLEKELVARVAALARRARPQSTWVEDGRVTAVLDSEGKVRKLLIAIERLSSAFRAEKLHPRVVEEVLGITAQERIRWTKDGRLHHSGKGTFSSGWQLVRFPLYRREHIAHLAQSPEVIRQWRAGDVRPAGDLPPVHPEA